MTVAGKTTKDEKPRFKVGPVGFDDGEPVHVLVDTRTGREIGFDGGEPEDRFFSRDWGWVPKELNALAEILDARDDEIAAKDKALWDGLAELRRQAEYWDCLPNGRDEKADEKDESPNDAIAWRAGIAYRQVRLAIAKIEAALAAGEVT